MRLSDIRTAPTADIQIPVEYQGLYDLAYNLWWSWNKQALYLFQRIDPIRWNLDHNPVELLINLEPNRWEALLIDRGFAAHYKQVMHEFEEYRLGEELAWFRRVHPDYDRGPIAYFSTEYGWHECLSIYSGGLGILAGDHCKAASDLGLPFVGVGLMYRRGYFHQTIDADGHQQHHYYDYDFRRIPALPIVSPSGRPIQVSVDFPGRDIYLRLWKVQVGRAPVILLDTDVRENHPADRPITSILYIRGREMRLCQEFILGIGGTRALKALGIEPAVWHMNEGHSALLAFERIQEIVRMEGVDFEEALRRSRGSTLFTTHTPVPAGNESFDWELIRKYFSRRMEALGTPQDRFKDLGRGGRDNEENVFNLTAFAIRTSRETNGVSRMHGKVAQRMWEHLDATGPEPRRPIGYVTNGVHVPSWIGQEMSDLLRDHLGSHFHQNLDHPSFQKTVLSIAAPDVWEAHSAQKRHLIDYTRQRVQEQFARHGRSPDELREIDSLLDEDTLTIGFARRFATYKRANLIFQNSGALQDILANPDRPVQIVFAGKAHPADRPGQDLIRDIFGRSLSPELKGRIVFLEDYDIRTARYLVQGVDLWLNTPRRPLEASGTSGMKAAVNGVLNFSVLDGWWAEGHDPAHGWALGKDQDYEDTGLQDREDLDSFYSVLREQIIPCYYDIDAETRLPLTWIEKMKRALADLMPRFNTERMVREYTEKYYLPASQS